MDTPSFNFDDDATPDLPASSHDWLVPQRVFLSWHPSRQAAFMAARDRDSATSAVERGEDPTFYEQRAEAYER